jgi:hypothetical protein
MRFVDVMDDFTGYIRIPILEVGYSMLCTLDNTYRKSLSVSSYKSLFLAYLFVTAAMAGKIIFCAAISEPVLNIALWKNLLTVLNDIDNNTLPHN